jgi:hypothetical protein
MTIDTDVSREVLAVRARIDDPALPGELLADGLRLLDAFHTSTLGQGDAARLGLALHVVYVRDVAWQLIRPGNAAELAPRWRDLAQVMPSPLAAPAAHLAAVASLISGDAATAQEAIDVALAGDSRYSAANLLQHFVTYGLEPMDLTDVDLPEPLPAAPLLAPLRARLDAALTLDRCAV